MKNYLNKTDDEKHMHDGHRARLIDTVYKVGLSGLSDVQFMEYVLFFIFPRGDVNPLAHRLLNKFGDVPAVMEASIDKLMQIKGMGEKASKKLVSLLETFYEFTYRKMMSNKIVASTADFLDYIEQLLRFRKREELHLFGINSKGEITKSEIFGKGTNAKVTIELLDVMNYAKTNNINMVVLVHNHPDGDCKPSANDEKSFVELGNYFESTGCYLHDSYIVGKDGIYSMRKNAVERIFNATIKISQSQRIAY